MAAYRAPVSDMRFVVNELAAFEAVRGLVGNEELGPELVDAILDEADRFASGVLAPLNVVGDREGCVLENGVVRTASGFREAYAQFVDGGWNGVHFAPEHGGQGLPRLISTAVSEMWTSANMAFALCPMLTQAAAEALAHHGSERLKATYLPKLVSGQWAGTMNLTEPQAGSDLALVRTRAVPEGNGTYRITGQKIFITFGDHDLTENIIHLVLARLPDAPAGVHGLSLFLVPKVLVHGDGSLGLRNDLRVVSLEHKLGINGSPTAVLSYGDNDGALGYLVGEENRGLELMFTMMNAARLAVGLEGIGIAERAYQDAKAYAMERIQGRQVGSEDPSPVPIAHHPDVQRMLMSMKSQIETCSRRWSRHGLPTSASTSRTWPSRSTAAWATSRRAASRSTCAMRASPPSTRAPTESRRATSPIARSLVTAVPRPVPSLPSCAILMARWQRQGHRSRRFAGG
jgi:alkylation response protein AidB-like acyl-CoA dehydrogenase